MQKNLDQIHFLEEKKNSPNAFLLTNLDVPLKLVTKCR